MSSQQKTGLPEDAVPEESIAQYLQMHPDFFERHPSLLANLRLAHTGSGEAVSLIERQVTLLRARNAKLERKLQELVTIMGSNHSLLEKILRLAERFLDTRTADEVVAVLRESLVADFGAEFPVLLVFDDAPGAAALGAGGWVRHIDRREPASAPFGSLLNADKPRCGRFTEAQRDFVFGGDGARVASAALTPLGAPAIGLLGIGSSDPDRFLPTMSVDFLSRVGGLISHAVRTRTS